jgi:glycosyltransferase involved in cell wall biosynthesis
MNVLLLTLDNFKNITNRGVYTDLLREFRKQGHDIYAVCPREKRSGQSTELIVSEDAQILQVRVGNITKSRAIEKGIATILVESQYSVAIEKYFGGITFDLVLYSTPPITFTKVINNIRERDNAKTYLLLKDIFPQNAVDLEMIKEKGILHKYFRNKEKKLYAVSDHIGCMSQVNVDYVVTHNPGIEASKVEVCPNSIEPIYDNSQAGDTKNIREKYDLPLSKTIFIYGGNLGKPQGIDFIINCLHANRNDEQAFFLIIGSGTEFNKLEKYFIDVKPQNAKLIQQLPREEYEQITNACDVGLIFLDHRFTIPNYPSRLLSYMQASIPVLAATDVNTDIGQTIEQGEFGYWCESNDVQGFTAKVQKLLDSELRKQMGSNARAYLENNFTAQHSYNIIMKHFESENDDV